jgi:glyoxylase-like metal-dependent hydrolase (beta-lactamase superfamily II)
VRPIRFAAALAFLAWLVAPSLIGAANAQGVDKLYVIDCGWSHAPDQSRWSPGVNVGVPIDFSGNCYLIHHSQGGYLLWDTGITDAVAERPNGYGGGFGAPVWHRSKTLIASLAELNLKPSDIRYVAVSHSHPDHVGNVDEFPNSMLLIQKAEFDYAMKQERKPFNPERPVTELDGDKDVFGDGSVTLISTPGHTPGHESLLVHLSKTGWIVLGGDVVHFKSNWENRIVPSFNIDQAASKTSMQRVADLLAEHKAQLWINHDKPQSDALKHSPDYYE